eukprot:scaffold29049_cov22-Tisochrysis_lutea.AAC.2
MTHALEQAAADLIMDFLKARQYAGRKEAAAAAMRATAAQECYLACRPLHATAMQQYLYVSAAVSGMHACCMADACRRACNSSAASCATIGVHAFQACKSERLAVPLYPCRVAVPPHCSPTISEDCHCLDRNTQLQQLQQGHRHQHCLLLSCNVCSKSLDPKQSITRRACEESFGVLSCAGAYPHLPC